MHMCDFQCHRLADAHHGQGTLDLARAILFQFDIFCAVGDVRKFGDIEKIRRTQMIITLLHTGIHRGRINPDVHRAGHPVTIQPETAAGLAKAAIHGGITQMINGEIRIGMKRINGIIFGGRMGRQRHSRQHHSRQNNS